MRPKLDWLRQPIAHRGLHNNAAGVIENTLPAIQAAINYGFAIEIDIQPAADLTPVVFHDEKLDRLTEAIGPVTAASPAALKSVIFRTTTDYIPELTEALALIAGQVPVIVEIKSPHSSIDEVQKMYARKIASIVTSYRGPLAVASFNPRMLRLMSKFAPQIPRGLIATNKPRDEEGHSWWQNFQMKNLLWRRKARPHFIAYDIHGLPALAPFLTCLFYRLPLLAWTVRTPKEQRKARRWADAMIFEGFIPEQKPNRKNGRPRTSSSPR